MLSATAFATVSDSMGEKTRKQHYVPQFYLKAWCVDGDHLVCLRGGKIFRSRTEGVAQQKDFYRLRELTARELDFVDAFLKKLDPALRELCAGWIDSFVSLFKFRSAYERQDIRSPEFEKELDHHVNDLEEGLHAAIEGDAAPLLRDLRAGSAVFLREPEKSVSFMWFIASQHLRTAKMQAMFEKSLAGAANVNISNAWGLLRTIFATTIGFGLWSRISNMKVVFLEAPVGRGFITSDQPTVNLLADGEKEPAELDFYYPLSPSRALLLTFRSSSLQVESRELTVDEVESLNRRVAAEAHEQIYAANERDFPSVSASESTKE